MSSDRALTGQARVGYPLIQAFKAVTETVEAQNWPDFRPEPVQFYFEKALGHWVPSMIDHTLTDEQLDAVQDEDVHVLAISLLRDLFRHQHAFLRSSEPSSVWVEPLFESIAQRLNLPPSRLQDDRVPYDLEDINSLWPIPLTVPFGIMPQKLFAVHSACVTGCQEGSRKKPWWKFW